MGRKKKGDLSPKKIRVSYTIKPELNDEIIALADKHSQSVSSVFEEAIEYFLQAVKQKELEKAEKVIEIVIEEKEAEKVIEVPKQSKLKRRPKNE
jgi:predicted transcriptional regulator